MESINALVKTIIAISFMWCLAENIMPQSQLNKYTEYIYGLIITTVIISAIIKVNPDDFLPDFENTYNTDLYTQDYLREVYELKLEQILIEKVNDKNISVELDDDYKITDITCKNQATYEKIMGYINE